MNKNKEKLYKMVEKVNRNYEKIADMIYRADIDWYGLRRFDVNNMDKPLQSKDFSDLPD